MSRLNTNGSAFMATNNFEKISANTRNSRTGDFGFDEINQLITTHLGVWSMDQEFVNVNRLNRNQMKFVRELNAVLGPNKSANDVQSGTDANAKKNIEFAFADVDKPDTVVACKITFAKKDSKNPVMIFFGEKFIKTELSPEQFRNAISALATNIDMESDVDCSLADDDFLLIDHANQSGMSHPMGLTAAPEKLEAVRDTQKHEKDLQLIRETEARLKAELKELQDREQRAASKKKVHQVPGPSVFVPNSTQ